MFQSLDGVELPDKCHCFAIFAGRPSVLEGTSDSKDLFNLANVLITTFNVVVDSHDGGCHDTTDRGWTRLESFGG